MLEEKQADALPRRRPPYPVTWDGLCSPPGPLPYSSRTIPARGVESGSTASWWAQELQTKKFPVGCW